MGYAPFFFGDLFRKLGDFVVANCWSIFQHQALHMPRLEGLRREGGSVGLPMKVQGMNIIPWQKHGGSCHFWMRLNPGLWQLGGYFSNSHFIWYIFMVPSQWKTAVNGFIKSRVDITGDRPPLFVGQRMTMAICLKLWSSVTDRSGAWEQGNSRTTPQEQRSLEPFHGCMSLYYMV